MSEGYTEFYGRSPDLLIVTMDMISMAVCVLPVCHGIISIITQIPPYLADTRFNLADTRTTSTTFVHYQIGPIG